MICRTLLYATALMSALLAGCADDATTSSRLPALGAALDQTSASGISSGAYMAGQFQMAHDEIVVGAAIIAGGPYGCAESAFTGFVPGPGAAMINLNKAVSGCMLDGMRFWGVPDAELLADRARRRAEKGEIDAIASITTDRIYLYTGTHDRIVASRIVERTADFYRALGVPKNNIELIDDSPAGHAFVTETEGGSCGTNSAPFVSDCDYDQAGALLKQIYGPLAPPAGPNRLGTFSHFDQKEFFADSNSIGMADMGIAYVPEACRTTVGCRIHIAFHGCAQNEDAVGDAFTARTGFARWADTNRLIVLFPQTKSSGTNPQGCWDWWGYTGRDFLTRNAPQIKAVKAMLDRLASPARSG